MCISEKRPTTSLLSARGRQGDTPKTPFGAPTKVKGAVFSTHSSLSTDSSKMNDMMEKASVDGSPPSTRRLSRTGKGIKKDSLIPARKQDEKRQEKERQEQADAEWWGLAGAFRQLTGAKEEEHEEVEIKQQELEDHMEGGLTLEELKSIARLDKILFQKNGMESDAWTPDMKANREKTWNDVSLTKHTYLISIFSKKVLFDSYDYFTG